MKLKNSFWVKVGADENLHLYDGKPYPLVEAEDWSGGYSWWGLNEIPLRSRDLFPELKFRDPPIKVIVTLDFA